MIELWHCPDARSFRVLWALEELSFPYELHLLPFPPRVRQPEYLEINPLGTIPAMRDGAVFMTESAAIVQYLSTRDGPSGLALEPGDPDYGAWLNWLHFGEATLTFPQTLVLRYRQLEPGRAEHVADDYAKWFMSRLRHVDRALADGRQVAGRRTVHRRGHLGGLCAGAGPSARTLRTLLAGYRGLLGSAAGAHVVQGG